MISQPLVVVPRSLEPRQVNDFQEPVFTVRVSNAGDVDIEVLPRTRLWVVDYETSPERGFAAELEAPVYVPARREAVMRFQPVRIEVPTINSGIFPLRIHFAILLNGSEQSFTTVSSENCVRVGGRVRAVVAESAAIEMGAPTCALPSVSGGEELDIQATLTNPFHYEVDLANHGIPSLQRSGQSVVIDETGMFSCRPRPRRQDGINRDDVGVRAYREGVEVPDVLDFVTMIAPDSLQLQESRSVGWRVRISHSALRGRYRLQPFTTSTVWLSARFGNWPKLETRIDPGASDPAFGVEIDVT
jgi:hypothetical protein